MTGVTGAIARIEARHLARSPLLWVGFALALALLVLNQLPFMSWPVLAGDDLYGYQTGYLLSGGALLAGAWLALRDRVTGTADLVAVTPTAPWRLVGSRLASVAAVAAGAFAVTFAAALAVSAVRGGRGMPELRLLADGALAVVLGGWVGFAVGRRSGSRMASVLAAPVWVAACVMVGGWPAMFGGEPALAVQRLAPLLAFNSATDRSAALGFLPDPLWPHLGYLLGLVLLVGVGLLTLAARGGGQRPPVAPVLAAVLAGVVLAAAGGVGVVTLPHRLMVLGPDRADWRPLREVTADAGDRPWSYPDDGRARVCAGDATLMACVYPAYGQRLAQVVRDAVAPVAVLFAGLPGVPTRVRMVPSQDSSSSHSACRGTEAQVGEPEARALSRDDRDGRFYYVDVFLRCALGERNWGIGVNDHLGDEPPSEALEAVKVWALVASGNVTGEALRRAWAEEGHQNRDGDPIRSRSTRSRRSWSRPPTRWPRCRPSWSGPSWRRSGSGYGPVGWRWPSCRGSGHDRAVPDRGAAPGPLAAAVDRDGGGGIAAGPRAERRLAGPGWRRPDRLPGRRRRRRRGAAGRGLAGPAGPGHRGRRAGRGHPGRSLAAVAGAAGQRGGGGRRRVRGPVRRRPGLLGRPRGSRHRRSAAAGRRRPRGRAGRLGRRGRRPAQRLAPCPAAGGAPVDRRQLLRPAVGRGAGCTRAAPLPAAGVGATLRRLRVPARRRMAAPRLPARAGRGRGRPGHGRPRPRPARPHGIPAGGRGGRPRPGRGVRRPARGPAGPAGRGRARRPRAGQPPRPSPRPAADSLSRRRPRPRLHRRQDLGGLRLPRLWPGAGRLRPRSHGTRGRAARRPARRPHPGPHGADRRAPRVLPGHGGHGDRVDGAGIASRPTDPDPVRPAVPALRPRRGEHRQPRVRRRQGRGRAVGAAGHRQADPGGDATRTDGGPGPIALLVPQSAVGTATALAMAELPAEQVRAELAPLWERLRAGTLPLTELPGQRL